MMIMYWHRTFNKADADDLYAEISQAAENKILLEIHFKAEIQQDFANRFLEYVYTGEADLTEIRKYIKLTGFTRLKERSWDNMLSAKIDQINNLKQYTNMEYMDGW